MDHSLLYDPHVARALDLVRAGKLGRIVSVDVLRSSVYPPYRGGPLPPQYRTAGYPFRDLGVHALYLFEAFLGPIEDVNAAWSWLGGDPNLAYDEWRALVRCRGGIGQVQLSWNVKPLQNQIIIQGTRGVLRLDLFLMFQAKRAALPVPKPAERIANALTDSLQPLVQVPIGVARFALGRVKPFQGLHGFVHAFYGALAEGAPMPVALSDATRVVRWVETVARTAEAEHASKARPVLSSGCDVLVTGASGAVGEAVLARLAGQRKVRILVRRPPKDVPAGVEVVVGDLGDPDAVDRAVAGCCDVVHVGAATRGGWDEHERATVVGTRNVVEACRAHGVRRLVHISSMSVSDWVGAHRGELSEETPYEPRPLDRGHYPRAKLEAEKLVLAAVAEHGLPAVILRPGKIFGGRLPLLSPAVARRLGRRWIVLGAGAQDMGLVYLDDVVDAIVAALDGPLDKGQVIQLVDPHPVTQNEVLAALAAGEPVVHVPRPLLLLLGRLTEPLAALLRRRSPLSAYRLKSALSRTRFVSKNSALLGWSPRVGVLEGLRRAAGAAATGVAGAVPRESPQTAKAAAPMSRAAP